MKKDYLGNTKAPQRVSQHEIDTNALRFVQTKLTPDWVERSYRERDYGVDMMLEVFHGGEPTGTLALLQIKGRDAAFDDDNVALSVPVKTLLYVRAFATPVFLVHVSITSQRAYFVWLQKYINTRLTATNPRWTKQEEVTIHFPQDNTWDALGLSKVRQLATYVAHRDLGIQFLRHLTWLRHNIDDFLSTKDRSAVDQAISRVKEIEKLAPFLAVYEDSVPEVIVDFDRMRKLLLKAAAYRDFGYEEDEAVLKDVQNLDSVALMFLSNDEDDGYLSSVTATDTPY